MKDLYLFSTNVSAENTSDKPQKLANWRSSIKIKAEFGSDKFKQFVQEKKEGLNK
jgi:hypothetical protein